MADKIVLNFSGCFETGLAIEEEGYSTDKTITTPKECQEKCASETACNFFFYTKDGCQLFDKNPTIENVVLTRKNTVFGPKSCDGSGSACEAFDYDVYVK